MMLKIMTMNIVSPFARFLKVLFLSLFLCLSTAAQAQTRQPDLEFDLHSDNYLPTGIWSNRTTMWVADGASFSRYRKIYAYTLSDGGRDSDKDIDLHVDNDDPDMSNTNPTGIWSDGITMWVVDSRDDKLYAYTLSDGSRDQSKEFDLHRDNTDPQGIWSNDTTMWVADWLDDKLYAYTLTGNNRGSRDDTQDIDLHEDNGFPQGIWSNGTTMWVVNDASFSSRTSKTYAYRLTDGRRIRAQEFDLHEDYFDRREDNNNPRGIWSNGTILWVVDWDDEKLYAYTLPPFPTSTDASLSALAIAPRGILSPSFAADTLSYTAGVVHGVTSITVTPTGTEDSAAITVNGNDDYFNYRYYGSTVPLNPGPNTITIVVTSPDLSTERSYTLTVTHTDGVTDVSSVTDDGSYRSGADIDITVTFSGNVNVSGRPQLTLATGTTNRMAAYTGGSGSAILTFRYTVADGDSSTDLNYVDTMSLDLNGGTIVDGDRNAAVLDLPAPDSDNSLAGNAAIVIDTTAPTVSIIAPPRAGSAFPAMFTFSEDMTGFDMSDIMVTGGRASNFIRVDPRQYTATITAPSGDTPVTLDVAAGAATDAAGNENTVATRVAVEFGAITVSPASVTTTEAAETERMANFEVSLNQAPATDETVTISMESSDTTEGTVAPSSLTFTADNHNTPQTVTVTGVDDAIDDGDVVYNINLMATSSDMNGDLHGELNQVRVTNSDDDSRGITVMPTTLTFYVNARTDEYTVELDTEPTGNITITPSSSATATATVSGNSLTFTGSDWDTPQTVTVTGVAVGEATISHTVAGADSDYSSVMARDVTVTVRTISPSDINRDGVVDDNDALLVFYGLRFGNALRLLDEQRRILIGGLARSGKTDDNEEHLAMIDRAERWVNYSRYDINQDGEVNDQDALLIFYGMRFGAALMLLDEPRRILIGGLCPLCYDEERLRMIRAAGNVFRR